jgi:hypothetical protein
MHFGSSDIAIVVYCWIAWCWNLPADSGLRRLVNPLSPLVQWLGLWHDWRMFAPNPMRTNRRVLVRVDYSDGTRREWRPPSTGDVGWWRGFLYARVRKFSENVYRAQQDALRVSFAYYVLMRMASLEVGAATPRSIEIIEEFWPIVIDPRKAQTPITPSQRVLYRELLSGEGAT